MTFTHCSTGADVSQSTLSVLVRSVPTPSGAGAVIGLFCFSPDAGSYPQWEAEVNTMLQRYQPAFNKSGLTLSLQHNR